MYDELWTAFYKNIELIKKTDKLIMYFRGQNYDRALRISGGILKEFQEALPFYEACKDFYNEDKIRMDLEYVMGMLTGLLDAQEGQDFVLLADLYELQILPFLLDLQEKMILEEGGIPAYNRYRYKDNYQAVKQLEPNLSRALSEAHIPQWLMKEGGYTVEYTASGEPTLKVACLAAQGTDSGRDADSLEDGAEFGKLKREYYLHSNSRPEKEAFEAARVWYRPEKEEYIIYGLGFGYHIKALSELDPYARIEVYESDIDTIQMAAAYAELRTLLEKPMITLHYDKDLMAFSEKVRETTEEQEVVIFHPSLYCVKNQKIREILENYFIQYSSVKNQLANLNGNFRSNIQLYTDLVDVLKPELEGKKLYVVAAGPSLDLNFMKLKEIGADGIILATETVFHKLMAAGIRPDYVIATDANQRVVGHINGLEDCGVPFLFLSTAFKGFARRYRGKKYIMFQKDYAPAEKMAASLGSILFETGGSVSTTALDLGIRFGCKAVIFLGLDLSYPGNLAHAEGTSLRKLGSLENFREVEDVYGGRVKTNKSMDIYRKWMEKRIERERKEHGYRMEFIDATEGGAKIAGMRIKTMRELLKREKEEREENERKKRFADPDGAGAAEPVKKKILIFKGNAKYSVTRYFADELIEGFRKLGYRSEVFDAKCNTGVELARMAAESYEFIFAVNGVFTEADIPKEMVQKLTQGGRNLCVAYLVDHPCHHRRRLSVFPEGTIVLCPDRNQAEYTSQFYPQVKQTGFLPHAGCQIGMGLGKNVEERKIELMFAGSYYKVSQYEDSIAKMEPATAEFMRSCIQILREKPYYQVEEAMKEVLYGTKEGKQIDFCEKSTSDILLFLDEYIRTDIRNRVITTIVESGQDIHVYGAGWQDFQCANMEHFIWEGEKDFELVLTAMDDAKLLLNIMPWFKDGSHERVFSAVLHGAVCLSDESRYLEETFKEGEEMAFYSLSRLELLPGQIKALLANPGKLEEMRKKGFEKGVKDHLWENRAREILEYIKVHN